MGITLDVTSGQDTARAVGDDVHRLGAHACCRKPIVTEFLEPVAEVVKSGFPNTVGDGESVNIKVAIEGRIFFRHRHPPVPVGRIKSLWCTYSSTWVICFQLISHIHQRLDQVVIGIHQRIQGQ